MFLPHGAHENAVTMPPDGSVDATKNFWAGSNIVTSGALAPTMHIGKIMQEPAGTVFRRSDLTRTTPTIR